MDLKFIFTLITSFGYIFCLPNLRFISRTRKFHICGSDLVDTLSIICRGKYNTPPPPEKRNDVFRGLTEDLYAANHKYPLLTKENEIAVSIPYKRDGIVDECCHKACDYAHLKQYCADDDYDED